MREHLEERSGRKGDRREDAGEGEDEGRGERGRKERRQREPGEIRKMTDTRFHPVEVTTMFVSRR